MARYRINKWDYHRDYVPSQYGAEEIDSDVLDLWDKVLFRINDIEYEVSKTVVPCGDTTEAYNEFRSELLPSRDWGNIIRCYCSKNWLEFNRDPRTHLYYTMSWEWFLDFMWWGDKVEVLALDFTPIFNDEWLTTWTEYWLGKCFIKVIKRERIQGDGEKFYFI